MLTLRDPADLVRVASPAVRHYLAARFEEVAQCEDYDPDVMGQFSVVEPGDTIPEIERLAGCWLTRSPFGGPGFGEPGYTPSFECLEQRDGFYEAVWTMDDGDSGVVVIVPDAEGIDPQLMQYCRTYATPAP